MWIPRVFPLARMSGDIRAVTGVCLLIPVGFAVASAVKPPMMLVAAFVCGVYLVVWFWMRPSRFVVMHDALLIEWPLRSRKIAVSSITDVERFERDTFRSRFGRGGARVGAGGLWGGFGLLIMSKETLAMYISRSDGYVVIRRNDDKPLLITPEEPDDFVAAIRLALGGAKHGDDSRDLQG